MGSGGIRERAAAYLLHGNAPFADNMLQPLHADGVQGQVEGQLCLREDNGQGARVLVSLQLAVEDERHDDDALFRQDEELHVHGAALGAAQDLPVERVVGQEGDLSVAEEHQLVPLRRPDVAHAGAQDVVPVGEGGGQQRAFSLYRYLRLCHCRRLGRTAGGHRERPGDVPVSQRVTRSLQGTSVISYWFRADYSRFKCH